MEHKFKVGDRVRNLMKDGELIVGDIGTVLDDDEAPYIIWDRLKEVLAQFESQLELVE